MSDLNYRQPIAHPEPYAIRSHRQDGTVGCRECGDTDWVEVHSTFNGIPTVRPCSRCRPETYKRWVDGFPGRDGRRSDPEPAAATLPPRPPTQGEF